jgi:hypothetical protein
LFVCPNPPINITDYMLKDNHSMKIYQMPLKRELSHPKMILKAELNY